MDKKLLGLITLFFLSFLFFLSVMVFNKPLSNLIRAKEDTTPSSTNSLIFAWPLKTKGDGKTKVEVEVFVRSTTNKVIPGRLVKVSSTLGQISPDSSVSDKNGQSTFTLISNTSGVAEITTLIDNSVQLSKKLTVEFE